MAYLTNWMETGDTFCQSLCGTSTRNSRRSLKVTASCMTLLLVLWSGKTFENLDHSQVVSRSCGNFIKARFGPYYTIT
ncbi:hypothetical protein EMPG_16999 [Blastomyces silverae]|uniref:Uncharacterized protein n=1 Tax=Blastomyces silverae TaxID=2060906 RepID=A0A0H1B936_9EURO|nr:hypothetical protein EMPG_16999 [Blastomyces silverae]